MGLLSARLAQSQPCAEDVAAEVQAIVAGIVRFGAPLRIYLFGSADSGKFTWASDIDVVVLFADKPSLVSGRKSILKHGPHSKVLVDYLFTTLDDFNSKSAVGGVYAVVKETGRVIYDQGPTF